MLNNQNYNKEILPYVIKSDGENFVINIAYNRF